MRGDHPVVAAASWMVRASTGPTLPTLCQGSGGHERARPRRSIGRRDDRGRVEVQLLVEADARVRGRVGAAQAGDDLLRAHGPVARPRLVDRDLGARVGGALALDELVGLLLRVTLLEAERLGDL